jgi:threonine dehydratase
LRNLATKNAGRHLYPPAVSEEQLVTLTQIEAAREVIADAVHRTPLLSSSTAARVVEVATGVRIGDGRVYLKAEHLQKTGSFKPRGMVNKLASLTDAERRPGVISFSAGNAAQGYAYAGATLGVPVTVVMPQHAVPSKVAACLGYGARVVLEGELMGDVVATTERIRAEEGLTFCHPFDDRAVIAGHGTVGLELIDDLPEVDVVVVGVGGGGLISGVSAAVKERRPSVRVYGVEPTTSDAMTRGLAAGEPVTVKPTSVADGLNAPFTGTVSLAMAQRYVDEVVLIDDATILAGLRFGLERLKQSLEPAGAAALAALLAGRIPVRTGERVCVVLSGGNVDMTRLGELLAMAAPIAVA